ncbi:RagB/SusD family protein [Galbibacter orientalis DSM 19592]|uniref:RagB/SusD family protein n=1 Tax=Galbibacter orientalis DSM 19592 TaxID=926559 RepID=I3C7I0_9FLAO|nr:RagB/SusD family nutrient uptake outer membrane protein [Galbibacter orientalis]EIJ39573.1 RagB/SusD family protein [Galbibacter orientalis DSM 19592]
MKSIKYTLIICSFIVFISCDKEYLDPYSVLDPTLTSSVDEQIMLLNGMQQQWSTNRPSPMYTTVTAAGLNTGELRLLNPGNVGENELVIGGSTVSGDNEVLINMWGQIMLIKKEATTIIDNANTATEDSQIANSLKAYALFYRALAHGTLIQFFESLPLSIQKNAPFNTRTEVLNSALTDLSTSLEYINNGLSTSVTSELFNSIDLKNSVYALTARYHLMLGNNIDAISAANNVNLNTSSTWIFEEANPNPLAFWFSSNNVSQAKDKNFGLPSNLAPSTNDGRIDFYVDGQEPDYFVKGFFTSNTDKIPVYLPGEMYLIQAEAYAREDRLEEATIKLNKVITKTPAQDIYGVAAMLPAYSGEMTKEAILDEIYKNRRIELYLSGLSLEDSRRFNRPTTERNRNYYPYPNSERDNNTQTPPNPQN